MDDLTIVTTQINNPSRIEAIDRFIEYHRRFRCDIIVVSPSRHKVGELEELEFVQPIRCEPGLGVFEKLKMAEEAIGTPYVAWIADDDFLGLDFAKKSVEALDSDDRIVACDGMSIKITEGDGKRTNYRYTYRNYFAAVRSPANAFDGLAGYAFQAKHFNAMALHGVMRSEAFKKVITELTEAGKRVPIRWADNMFLAYLLAFGSIRFIKTLSAIRSAGTRIIDEEPDRQPDPDADKRDLILDDSLIQSSIDHYKRINGQISAAEKAKILSFFIGSTVEHKRWKTGSISIRRVASITFFTCLSALDLYQLSIRNDQVREDLRKAKRLVRGHPLIY